MGSVLSFLYDNFPPKPKWSTSEVPDLSGKVIIVTGANSGVGKDTAKILLERNAKVYIATRSRERAEEAIKELREQTGKEGIFLKLDLADLKSVKSAAEEFISKENELHVLFNNGGVAGCPIDLLTTQGYDLIFGTNVIGHFYFTTLLLPTLISTAKSAPEGKVRIVHTSSYGHTMYPSLDFNTLRDGPARRKLANLPRYAQSKLGNILVSNEIARRYGDDGIISSAVHPGGLRTEILRNESSLMRNFFNWVIFYPSVMGTIPLLYAGTSTAGLGFNGKYITAWDRVVPPAPIAEDPALAKKLWEWLEEQVKDV